MIVVDNDTGEGDRVREIIDELRFPIPVSLKTFRHGDETRTHSWSTNIAVREAQSEWVLFTRADYLLDFGVVTRFVRVVDSKPAGWNGFVTGHVFHLQAPIHECERTEWRSAGPSVLQRLPGVEENHTAIDAGVWMARRSAFEEVGGLDERLSAWGHSQTHFQHKLHGIGVEFVRIPEPLFYHPLHAAVRDIELAHRQLADNGIDLKQMWKRHDGVQPYL